MLREIHAATERLDILFYAIAIIGGIIAIIMMNHREAKHPDDVIRNALVLRHQNKIHFLGWMMLILSVVMLIGNFMMSLVSPSTEKDFRDGCKDGRFHGVYCDDNVISKPIDN